MISNMGLFRLVNYHDMCISVCTHHIYIYRHVYDIYLYIYVYIYIYVKNDSGSHRFTFPIGWLMNKRVTPIEQPLGK